MSTKVNQEERAYRAWDILIKYASNKDTITYKTLGLELGVHHRTCRYFLDHVQNYCLKEKLPPLTILVVNQNGDVGSGFIAWDTNNFDEGLGQVFNFNWRNIHNPFSYAKDGDLETELVKKLIAKEIGNTELFSKVKVRGIAQSIFRKALLEVYENKCAFCRIKVPAVLEAAHIIPWSVCEDDEKININNGILLCSNHHKMFDAGLISINKDYSMHVSSTIKSKLQGRKLKLPSDKNLFPSKQYLLKKREYLNIIT